MIGVEGSIYIRITEGCEQLLLCLQTVCKLLRTYLAFDCLCQQAFCACIGKIKHGVHTGSVIRGVEALIDPCLTDDVGRKTPAGIRKICCRLVSCILHPV